MVASTDNQDRIPRAIEVGFPIVEINRLAQPERSSFKPIYQMHKWFARRASCVFRAILLGALKPAWKADGTPTDLMEEFYRNHGDDPDTAGKVVLDPFMGGGTTVVEALRLGCRVIGIDLNPVAWFIVKTEVEPVDLDALQGAFERLAARPVAWSDDKPLRETLLGLYRTTVAPDVEADVIYTFWVKHAICTDPTCKREVPLFKDYLVAHKALSVRYHRDVLCPRCKKRFDWEIEPVSLIADTAMMVNSPRGSAGEGRPHQLWTYAAEPEKPKGRRRREPTSVSVYCPRCKDDVRLHVPWDQKKERKKVPLTVFLCPACEAVWQWRGTLPDDAVSCPACGHGYDPHAGNLPAKGTFECSCGNREKIIESIRLLPQNRELPVRPYAIQAYLEPCKPTRERKPRGCCSRTRLQRRPHGARRYRTVFCYRRMASSSSDSPRATELNCSVPRICGLKTRRDFLIRKAGFRKVRKLRGCWSITTVAGTTCSHPDNCWRWRHCWKASWRRRTASSRKCCCVHFRALWRRTTCSPAHV